MPDDQRGLWIPDEQRVVPNEDRIVKLFELLSQVQDLADELHEYAIGSAAAIGAVIAERRYHHAYMRFMIKCSKKIVAVNNSWDTPKWRPNKRRKKSSAKARG
jgi:hypothetical protein